MKHLKHSFFLSILCPIVFFSNCSNSDNSMAENNTSITDENNTEYDSTNDKISEISSKILTSNSKIEISKICTQEPKGYIFRRRAYPK